MIKKILLWTLYVAFVGLIIFGAVYRSNAKLEDASPERESSQSQDSDGNRNQAGGGGNSPSSDHAEEVAENLEAPAPTEAIVASTSSDSSVVSFEADSEHEWVTLTGIVASVTSKTLTLTLDDGKILVIERRPWRFAQENNFTTTPGNRLEIIGFYENDQFQAAQIHDLTTDLLVRLRDETGHPLWASE